MIILGITGWLISAILAYFVAKAVVINCECRDWDRPLKRLIAFGSILLGPVALLLALKALLFIVMAKESDHRFTLHCRHD